MIRQPGSFCWQPTPMYQVIEFYQQNLQLARESGQRREEMSALASLARAYDALQERDKAVEFYEMALDIARQLGDSRAERDTLKHLNATLNPPDPKETKPKAKSKAVRSRKASVKTNSRKKSTAKAGKKEARKGKPRKFKPVLGQQDSGGTGLEE